MSDDLRAAYADLQAAASAMTDAATTIGSALSQLQSASLPASAFGHKGDKVASWYEENGTNAQTSLSQSQHSFQVLARGLRRAAAVYALVDAALGRDAASPAQGGH